MSINVTVLFLHHRKPFSTMVKNEINPKKVQVHLLYNNKSEKRHIYVTSVVVQMAKHLRVRWPLKVATDKKTRLINILNAFWLHKHMLLFYILYKWLGWCRWYGTPNNLDRKTLKSIFYDNLLLLFKISPLHTASIDESKFGACRIEIVWVNVYHFKNWSEILLLA